MNPVVNKTVAKTVEPKQDLGSVQQKGQPSKFDKVRVQLQDQQAGSLQLPPEVTQVSMQQKKVLESQLRKRLAHAKPGDAPQMFKVDMQKARTGLNNLTQRVNALPKVPAFDALRNRLVKIESGFNETGKLVNGLGKADSPRDLLKVQMQMYQLTQNMELVSKVVEQVSGGIKSILQTQV